MSEVFYIRGKRFEVNDNIGVTVDACGTEICVTFKDSNNGRAAEEAYKKLMKEGRYEQQQPNAVQADNAAFGRIREYIRARRNERIRDNAFSKQNIRT